MPHGANHGPFIFIVFLNYKSLSSFIFSFQRVAFDPCFTPGFTPLRVFFQIYGIKKKEMYDILRFGFQHSTSSRYFPYTFIYNYTCRLLLWLHHANSSTVQPPTFSWVTRYCAKNSDQSHNKEETSTKAKLQPVFASIWYLNLPQAVGRNGFQHCTAHELDELKKVPGFALFWNLCGLKCFILAINHLYCREFVFCMCSDENETSLIKNR